MAAKDHITEKNAYAYINRTLKKRGWDTRNPNKYPDGQVYTDNQALGHGELKKGLDKQRPENVVKLTETKFSGLLRQKVHASKYNRLLKKQRIMLRILTICR